MSGSWRLRGYTVEQLLGSGSSGEVWRARIAGTNEPVALKRFVAMSPDDVRRAQREAALLCALDHPHLIRLHAFVHSADNTVAVLDLAEGGSLAGLLAARGRLTPGEVITAVAPIAAALAYLHDEGVVHGDVSAGNILFTAAGVPLLADVGVARLTGDDGEAMSTPAYVDPSVAAGCVPGAQSDVFMLAGVALHALTGAPPWPGDTAAAALALAARGVLADVAERLAAAGVSPGMTRVICRALTVDPHRRGTAADLALDLRHSGEPVAVELAAGLARPEPVPGVVGVPAVPAVPAVPSGPRHAAAIAGARLPPDRSRPAFERPSFATGDSNAGQGGPGGAGAAPPTRMVGPRPRPVIPRPSGRSMRTRIAITALGVLITGLLAAAGAVWASSRTPTAHPAAMTLPAGKPATTPSTTRSPTAHAALAASQAPRSPTPVGRLPGASISGGPPPADGAGPPPADGAGAAAGAPDWRQVLQALDAVRGRAFATRDTRLLSQVYVDGPLLSADAAALRRIVPVGCSLAGVRTTYRDLHGSGLGTGAVVTATASLPATRLTCHGRLGATAAAAGPTRLRVQLVRTGAGLRIAALTAQQR